MVKKLTGRICFCCRKKFREGEHVYSTFYFDRVCKSCNDMHKKNKRKDMKEYKKLHGLTFTQERFLNSDYYIKQLLKIPNAPQELIEAKRELMKLKRELWRPYE